MKFNNSYTIISYCILNLQEYCYEGLIVRRLRVFWGVGLSPKKCAEFIFEKIEKENGKKNAIKAIKKTAMSW